MIFSGIKHIVTLYNNTLTHSVLTTYMGEKSTLKYVYNNLPKFDIKDMSAINKMIDDGIWYNLIYDDTKPYFEELSEINDVKKKKTVFIHDKKN